MDHSSRVRSRESGWDTRAATAKLPEYCSLHDPNMSAFWERPSVRSFLQTKGYLSAGGEPIDVDKKTSTLHIIEQEFKSNERAEQMQHAEEKELRRQIQVVRRRDVEDAHSREAVQSTLEDRKQMKEVLGLHRGW